MISQSTCAHPWWLQFRNGPLVRYVKVRVAHYPGMPGTFSPPPRVSDPDMHHGTCVTHVPWCMPGSLTSGFLWSRWQGKRSRYSRRMRNPQYYISGKRPLLWMWPLSIAVIYLNPYPLHTYYQKCLDWDRLVDGKFSASNFASRSNLPMVGKNCPPSVYLWYRDV